MQPDYQTRFMKLDAPTKVAADGALIVDMAFASSAPYERWFGTEVLDMNAGSVRLGRLKDGASLLYNHDWNDVRGVHVPESIRIEGNVLRGSARITPATQAGRDMIGMISDGTLSKASVGYQIHKVIEQTKDKAGRSVERELDGSAFERILKRSEQVGHCGDIAAFRRELDAAFGHFERADDEPVIYRVMDWEPIENSIVTIPADPSVGVGRSQTNVTVNVTTETTPAPETRATSASTAKGDTMEVTSQPAAGASAENAATIDKRTASEIERERQQAAVAMGRAAGVPEPLIQRWIHEGTPLVKIAAEAAEVKELRHVNAPPVAAQLGMSSNEKQRYSLVKAIRALKFGGQDRRFMEDAAFEMECSRAVAQRLGRGMTTNILIPAEMLQRPLGEAATQRAMATTPGASGGYLVNVTNMGFIDILRNRSVAMSMGARVLSGLTGNVTFARQTAKPSVTWQAGEGVSVTAADQTLGQLSMTPKTCIAITDVSEQLLNQSTPSAEAFIMADLARDVAIDGVDYAVINGTGGAQPLGIKNTTGITSGQDAASTTYAKTLAFVSTAAAANAIRGNPGWVANAAGAAILMQKSRFTNTDTPLWEGNIMDGTCVGFRAMTSEQLASGNLIFGSWDEVVIGEWGVLELATDTGGTRFNQAQVGIRAMWMVDVLLRYPQAFIVSVNLSA